jgi:hypothetical protein
VDLYDALGKPQGYLAIGDDVTSSATVASDTASWFGPLGLLLVLVAIVLVRRRRLPRIAVVAPATPLFWFAVVALTLTYHPFQGRFFIAPIGLSAALWGLTLRTRALAWGAVALAAVTALLSLDHFAEKPAGMRLLDRARTTSVWNLERWEVQSQHDAALAPVLQFLDQGIASHATVALALSDNGFGYPVFGPHLTRHVVLVPQGSNARDVQAGWLYASRDRAPQIDTSCWHAQLQSSEGSIYKRDAGCAAA